MEQEFPPLIRAAMAGEIEAATRLIANGAAVDGRGALNETALMLAAQRNHVAVVELLLLSGADVNAVDEFGSTALIWAAEYGGPESVRSLLAHGADVHATTSTMSEAIDSASNIETVLALRDAGADIDHIGGDGFNVLKRAAKAQNLAFVEQLLAIGANPNAASFGEGPLKWAVCYDQVGMTNALLRYGADPNMADVDGWTPLFCVRSVEVARTLLDAGADPSRTDLFERTALECAESEEVRAFISGWSNTIQAREGQ